MFCAASVRSPQPPRASVSGGVQGVGRLLAIYTGAQQGHRKPGNGQRTTAFWSGLLFSFGEIAPSVARKTASFGTLFGSPLCRWLGVLPERRVGVAATDCCHSSLHKQNINLALRRFAASTIIIHSPSVVCLRAQGQGMWNLHSDGR